MLIYLSVTFEASVDNNDLYGECSPDKLDEKFEESVVEKLGVNVDVIDCFSAIEREPYAVFKGKFEKTNSELYEKFGSDGLATTVKKAAEDVYECTVSSKTMEEWTHL